MVFSKSFQDELQTVATCGVTAIRLPNYSLEARQLSLFFAAYFRSYFDNLPVSPCRTPEDWVHVINVSQFVFQREIYKIRRSRNKWYLLQSIYRDRIKANVTSDEVGVPACGPFPILKIPPLGRGVYSINPPNYNTFPLPESCQVDRVKLGLSQLKGWKHLEEMAMVTKGTFLPLLPFPLLNPSFFKQRVSLREKACKWGHIINERETVIENFRWSVSWLCPFSQGHSVEGLMTKIQTNHQSHGTVLGILSSRYNFPWMNLNCLSFPILVDAHEMPGSCRPDTTLFSWK